MEIELSQLLTPTEAADLKGMSLNRFKYQIAKPGAPKPVIIGDGHPFYHRDEIRRWKPKNSRKALTAGKTAPTQPETERN